MHVVLNPVRKALPQGAYSRVLLPTFHGCQCNTELLRGERSRDMSEMLVRAANAAGLGVKGEPKITLFGETGEERMRSGSTIEFVLEASGFAIDFWPEGELVMPDGRVLYGTGHGNLHYCNRDRNFDKEAQTFINILRDEVLRSAFIETQGPFDMFVNRSMP